MLVIGLLRFSISSWFSFGRLYFSKNLSLASKLFILLAYSCCGSLLWSCVFLCCLLWFLHFHFQLFLFDLFIEITHEAYKKSLRNNPKDDETRYNLALAQKLLKDQQQDQQNQDQQQQQQEQKEDKQDQNKDQQEQDQKDQQQNQQQQQQNKNEMSKENAQQLLNAVMQDEKNVQDKVKKQLQIQGKKLEKDW